MQLRINFKIWHFLSSLFLIVVVVLFVVKERERIENMTFLNSYFNSIIFVYYNFLKECARFRLRAREKERSRKGIGK